MWSWSPEQRRAFWAEVGIVIVLFVLMWALSSREASARTHWPSDKQLCSCPVNFMTMPMKNKKLKRWCRVWSERMP